MAGVYPSAGPVRTPAAGGGSALECDQMAGARPIGSGMRFLLYNIRYAAGTGARFNLPLPGAGYLLGNRDNLDAITEFIKAKNPDVVGLVEVDTGSVRTGMVNQAEVIARRLGHYSTYQCKYA